MNASPVLTNSKLVNVQGILRNITQRKEAESTLARQAQALSRTNTDLIMMNEELEAFCYSVSHDLRAPLRSIDGFSQALLEDYIDKLDAQGKDYLNRVRAGAQRMGELIDDLLTLSRVTRTKLEKQTVDLSAFACNIAAQLESEQPERQVEFVIADGLTSNGDPGLLRAALENLLRNAWKFTSKHPHARVEFGITQVDDKAAFFIRDNGVGFDMAYVGKLFGPFQRLHGNSEFPGNGIGLATVQRIIHRHGGKVWAEGILNEGATFYFTLS
jgi:light-regulated signal transduction histidine kinase (bacteriophytochrome)